MHPCLRIPEILSSICSQTILRPEQMRSDDDLPSRNTTLQAVSLTCSAFHTASTPHRWSSIRNLRPLVKCMPQELWEEQEWRASSVGYKHRRTIIRRPILPDHMKYFDRFARHVKRLGIPPRYLVGPDSMYLHEVRCVEEPELCQALIAASGGRCLLPSLEEYYAHADVTLPRIPYLPFLLPTTLHTALFHEKSLIHASPHERFTLFVTLFARFPNIKKLVVLDRHGLSMWALTLDNALPVTEFICNSYCLTFVSVGPIEGRALMHLALLPSVTFLKLITIDSEWEGRFIEEDDNNFTAPASNHRLFPALQVLQVTATSMEYGTQIVRRLIRSTELREIRLQSIVHGNSSWDRLLWYITQGFGFEKTLERLEIEDRSSNEELISEESLRQAFNLQKLTEIALTSPVGFDITPKFIEDSTKAWPEIETLQLHHLRTTSPQDPKVTMSDLSIYAYNCPKLRTLCIRFDARNPASLPNPDVVPPPNHELHDLLPLNSLIENPGKVAAALSYYFPHLASEQLHYPERTMSSSPDSIRDAYSYFLQWDKVFELVPNFAAVRREERKFLNVGRLEASSHL